MYRLQRRYSYPHPVLGCCRHPSTLRKYTPADISQGGFADVHSIYIRNVCAAEEIFIPPPCAKMLQVSLHCKVLLCCIYLPKFQKIPKL